MVARREDDDRDLGWQLYAACRGEQAVSFYPPLHFERKELRLARERAAKAICAGCMVRLSCMGHALRTREPHGIWGGLNEAERKAITDPQT